MDKPSDIFDHTLVQTVTSATFEQEVLKSDKPVLVEFFARWCPDCKASVPEMDKLEQQRTDVKIVKVDVDASRDLKEKYFIAGMPTLVMIRKGDMIARQNGTASAPEMSDWVDQTLALPADFKLVITPVKLTDGQKKELRDAFEEAANKNPDVDKPVTFNGMKTTLREMIEKDLDSGAVAHQFEDIMTSTGAKLEDLLAGVRKVPLRMPAGAKF